MIKKFVITKLIMFFLVSLFTVISLAEAIVIREDENDPFDDLLSVGVESVPNKLGSILDYNAQRMGENVDNEIFPQSELDGYAQKASLDLDQTGYNHSGMGVQLPANITANPHTDKLYKKYEGLRHNVAITLPSEFSSLTKFIAGYINANATDDAVQINRLSHEQLAVQIVRASLCFGNDPLMVASKMRRETNFRRASVSPTGAVGFSQMTGDGISEVMHQLSGNPSISASNAKTSFVQAIRCFVGSGDYTYPSGTNEEIKNRLQKSWAWDIIYGQIMVKTLVSYIKASANIPENTIGAVEAYRAAFAMYNGDNKLTDGQCLNVKTVKMRLEYACSVIKHFQKMSAQWSRFIKTGAGQDTT